jgi:hypothetical protein
MRQLLLVVLYTDIGGDLAERYGCVIDHCRTTNPMGSSMRWR